MKFIKTVCLNDEHNQPINIYANEDGFWWEWTNDQAEKYGPYRSKSDAYLDAQAYANDGGIS